MRVSIIVGLLNEEKYLPRLIQDFKNQTYPKDKIELVFIDGMSTDSSWNILTDFKNESSGFYDIILLKNPKRILSAGMNIGIKHASGDCFLKVDCHSHIERDFVLQNVEVIKNGEKVCGGPRPNIIENVDNFSKALLLVEENMFGSGFANYRKQSNVKYVKSVFQGMYKREVFEKVGLLDELVGRVEDNEIHYRIRNAGYKIAFSNKILSYQYTRPTIKSMLKQKFSNGYWIGKVSHVYPKCFSLFHFAPFVFVVSIIVLLLLFPLLPYLFLGLLLVYLTVIIVISVVTIIKNPFSFYNLLIPFLIIMVHFSYGIGTIKGVIEGFKWKKDYLRNRKIDKLEEL